MSENNRPPSRSSRSVIILAMLEEYKVVVAARVYRELLIRHGALCDGEDMTVRDNLAEVPSADRQ